VVKHNQDITHYRATFSAPPFSVVVHKETNLSKDLLDGLVVAEVDDDVFVCDLRVPVNLAQYRVRPVDITDSNDVNVDVKLLVCDAAEDSLQPRQRCTTTRHPTLCFESMSK